MNKDLLDIMKLSPEYYTQVAAKLVDDGKNGYDKEFVSMYVVEPLLKAGFFENFVEAAGVLRDVYTDEKLDDFQRENIAGAIRDISSVVADMPNDEFWETPILNNAIMACMQGMPEDVTKTHCEVVFNSSLKNQYYAKIAQVQPEIASEVSGMSPAQIEHLWGNPPYIECPEIVE